MNLDEILHKHAADIESFREVGEISDELFDALYEHWLHEMPYGTAKARDGDPGEWIADRLEKELA